MSRPKATTTPSGTSASSDVVDAVGDRQAELERGRLHRATAPSALPRPRRRSGWDTTSATSMPAVDERAQRRDGQVGRAEVGDPPDRTGRRGGEAQRSRVSEG